MKTLKKWGAGLVAAIAATAPGLALADMVTEASTAIQNAQADALSVGEIVVIAVAGLVVIGLVITIVRKL